MEVQLVEARLIDLASRLIAELTRADPAIREGLVMTVGPAPYRRLDCGGRALAYIRARPRKRAVRVDVSGLWAVPYVSRLAIPSSNGSTALVLEGEEDIAEAVRILTAAVTATRG